MDYDKYFDLIEKRKFDEAVKYKVSQIPDVLYKYYCLDDRDDINEEKLKTLENNDIYVSYLKDFNDPFEGHFLIFNNEQLEQAGWKRSMIDMFWEDLNRRYKVACLSDTSEQNMPMWAYYANNHRGFCAEYRLTDTQKKFVFPVVYEEKRQFGTSIVANLISGIVKAKGNEDLLSDETNIFNHLVFLSLAAKQKSWEHEKEFRIIMPSIATYFPAIPSKVYIGKDCRMDYVDRMKNMSEVIAGTCELFQMSIDQESEDFCLSEQRISL